MSDNGFSLDKIFDDPGEKLKKLAKILFIINCVAAVILALSFGFEETYYEHTEFRAGLFFMFMIGIPLASYVECLCLYGFGVLIDAAQPHKGLKKNDKTAKTEPSETQPEAETAELPSGWIACPKCGCQQPSNRYKCLSCGHAFDNIKLQ